jgi:hypothetical protein
MGNCSFKCVSKEKEIKVFTDLEPTFEDIVREINNSKLLDDCNIMIFIDGSVNNLYKDGSSDHDLYLGNYMNHKHIDNKYIFNLKVINMLIEQMDIKKNKNEIKMYLYGTQKANLNKNKLEEIIYEYDNHNNEITKRKNNIFINEHDIINGYIGTIKTILDKNYHDKYGENGFSHSSILPIIKEAITEVSDNGKFTIIFILTVGNNDNTYDDIIKDIFFSSQLPIVYICIYLDEIKKDYEFLSGIDILDYDKFYTVYESINTELKRQSSPRNFKKIVHRRPSTIVSDIKFQEEIFRKFDNFTVILMQDIIKRPIISPILLQNYYKILFNHLPKQYKYIQQNNVLNYKPNVISENKEKIEVIEVKEIKEVTDTENSVIFHE